MTLFRINIHEPIPVIFKFTFCFYFLMKQFYGFFWSHFESNLYCFFTEIVDEFQQFFDWFFGIFCISSANNDFFLSDLDAFYFFVLLIALAKTWSTILNRSGLSGHLCLVPDLRGNTFSFSPLIAIGLLYMALIMLKYVTFHTQSAKSFCHEGRLGGSVA